MMTYFVMVVRDTKAEVYGVPYFAQSIGSALRGFTDQINSKDSDNVISRHPEDFVLYTLGTYSDSIGEFSTSSPRAVARGEDLVRR